MFQNTLMSIGEENSIDQNLPNEAATVVLAAQLAATAGVGDVFALTGALGDGKSFFARAFIRAYCGITDDIPSPTFTLVQAYDGGVVPVFHFDLYRLHVPEECLELGVEDAFTDGISLIEWPDRLGSWLPTNRLEVNLRSGHTDKSRQARLIGHGYWRARLIDGLGEGAMHA